MSSRSLPRRHNQPARTPAKGPSIPLLPVELLGLITDELSTSTADLKSLSLASQAFLRFARRYIFRHLCVSLTPSHTMQDFESFLLHASPPTRDAVRSLTLQNTFNWRPTGDLNDLPWQSISLVQLSSFLTYLPRVERFILSSITIKGTVTLHPPTAAQAANTTGRGGIALEMTPSPPRHLQSLDFWCTRSTLTTAESCLLVFAKLFTIGTLTISNWSIDPNRHTTPAISQTVPIPATALRIKSLQLEAEADLGLSLQGWIGLLTQFLKNEQEARTSSLEELCIKCEKDRDVVALGGFLSLVGPHTRELMLDMPEFMLCCDHRALARALALRANCPALQVITLFTLLPWEDEDIDGGEEESEFAFCLRNVFETVASVATSTLSPLNIRFHLALSESPSTSALAAIARHCSDVLRLVHSGSIKHLELILDAPERSNSLPADGVAYRSHEDVVKTNLQGDAVAAECVREGKITVRRATNLDM